MAEVLPAFSFVTDDRAIVADERDKTIIAVAVVLGALDRR